jgi:DNA-binding NtrC family response regulator
MPLDMDRIAALGKTKARAQANADRALEEALDQLEVAYEAGERVNVKRVSELLGMTRQDLYRKLDERGVERLRAA